MSGLEFTSDWVSGKTDDWLKVLAGIRGRNNVIVELGVYEGRATRWFVDQFLNDGRYFAVDPFLQGTMPDADMKEVKGRFESNLHDVLSTNQLRLCQTTSEKFFYSSLGDSLRGDVDLIYVDADHATSHFLFDVVNAARMLRRGGVLLMDDLDFNENKTAAKFVNRVNPGLRPIPPLGLDHPKQMALLKT